MNEREIVRAVADNFVYDDVRAPDEPAEPWRTVWLRTDESLTVCKSARAGGEVPSAVGELLRGLHWCDEAKEYLEVEGPERVALRPL
jgi:hypothetical protein